MKRVLFLLSASLFFSESDAVAEPPLPVELIRATSALVKREIKITGTIEAASAYSASFQNSGRLVRLDPQVGDRVKAGTSIGAIDITQQTAVLDANKAAVDGAEAALSQALKDYYRQAALLKRGFVTRARFETANRTLVQAKSAVDQAQSRFSASRTTLGNAELIIPEDSIVTSRNAEPGQVVGAGQPIVGLASLTQRDAVFLVPDGSEPERYIGETINLRILDRNVSDLTAVVSEVSPVVNAETGSIRVKARVIATTAAVALLGEAVEGRAIIEEAAAISLPWNSLTANDVGMAVWTVEPDTMKARLFQVKVERFNTDKVIVSGGLSEGALVVGEGSQLLFPGRTVRDVKGDGS